MAQKILIIDDDTTFLRLVDQVLSGQGYEVLKADNGLEGLRLLFARKPDLVLLDVVMPKMDGWITCQRIREISDVPIIMFTGIQQAEEDIVRGLDYGADEYLFKPVGNRELVARIRSVFRRLPDRQYHGAADYCKWRPGKTNATGIPPVCPADREGRSYPQP